MRTGRRLVTVAALATVVLTLAACSASKDAASTTGTSASPATGAPTTGPSGTTVSGGKKTSAASSDELKRWQTDLNKVGCDAGPVDGTDGGETEAAIRNFQVSSGLTVDGEIGPQTEAALTKAAAAGTQVCKATPGTTAATASTATTASSAPPTSAPSTTQPDGSCPGPGCTDFSITPASGAVGTTITVHSVSGACTTLGVVAMNPTSPPGPSIAQGTLTAQGASQYVGSITVPAGAAPGTYLVNAWSTGAQMSAGVCQAPFTVTG